MVKLIFTAEVAESADKPLRPRRSLRLHSGLAILIREWIVGLGTDQ